MNDPGPAPIAERSAAARAGTLGIFVINFDRSPERWTTIKRHFGSLPWPLHRVASVGAKLRDPVRYVVAQALRRFGLSLWRAAAQGSPATLLSVWSARWWPKDFPTQVSTAAHVGRQ